VDAYQAPYKDQHHYWTGVLFRLHCVLFLVFALNTPADPSINLLAISLVAFGLTVGKQCTGAVCKNLYIDFLEVSFIINLGILSFATCYVKLVVVYQLARLLLPTHSIHHICCGPSLPCLPASVAQTEEAASS